VPSDDDIALDEKRMYGDKRRETVVYVAGGTGLTRVEVAGDQVGRFELASRDPARDVAGRDGRLLVATDEDVLVGTGEGFEPTGFGPAAAVGLAPGAASPGWYPVAAAPDGGVAVLRGNEWEPVGTVDEPRAIDGDLLAAGDGVYRVDGDGLDPLREGPATDVAAAGSYAACPDGLYELPDRGLREGEHTVVAADASEGRGPAGGDRAHTVAGGDLFARRDGWDRVDLPTDEPVVDVAYGESVYAVTAAGTLLVDADPEQTPDGHGGWRSRALGVREVRRLAVP
jgi:hypothetical protein